MPCEGRSQQKFVVFGYELQQSYEWGQECFFVLDESFRNTIKFGNNSKVSIMGK